MYMTIALYRPTSSIGAYQSSVARIHSRQCYEYSQFRLQLSIATTVIKCKMYGMSISEDDYQWHCKQTTRCGRIFDKSKRTCRRTLMPIRTRTLSQRLHNRNRSAAARRGWSGLLAASRRQSSTWHTTASFAWQSLAKCRNCYPNCSPRTFPSICIFCIAFNSQYGTVSVVGAIYSRGRIRIVDGGGFFDGPANFSTSRFPPGGDGRMGSNLFRDSGNDKVN